MVTLTSCRLISLVDKVPFWWTSRVSDHSVLFLLFGGVGAAALLQGFWGAPGDLPSLLKEAWTEEGRQTRPNGTTGSARAHRAHLDGLAEAPDGPILHRGDEVG